MRGKKEMLTYTYLPSLHLRNKKVSGANGGTKMSKRKQETRRQQIRKRYLRRLKRKKTLVRAARAGQQKSETVQQPA